MSTVRTTYMIRVNDHLDDHWSHWLGDLAMTRDDDTTTITVSIADQAQLHGLLAQLRDIGAVITDLRIAGAPDLDELPTIETGLQALHRMGGDGLEPPTSCL